MRVDLPEDRCGCAAPVRAAGSVLCGRCSGNLPKFATLVLSEAEMLTVWTALQQFVDNTEPDDPREEHAALTAQKLVHRIEADFIAPLAALK